MSDIAVAPFLVSAPHELHHPHSLNPRARPRVTAGVRPHASKTSRTKTHERRTCLVLCSRSRNLIEGPGEVARDCTAKGSCAHSAPLPYNSPILEDGSHMRHEQLRGVSSDWRYAGSPGPLPDVRVLGRAAATIRRIATHASTSDCASDRQLHRTRRNVELVFRR